MDRPQGRQYRRNAGILIAVTVSTLVLMGVPDRELSLEDAAAERTRHEIHLCVDDLRAAVEEYRRDHGTWPGIAPGGALGSQASEGWFVWHLTMASNENGEIVPRTEEDYPYGPYLIGELPLNPTNERRDVRIVGPGEEPVLDGCTGWIYDPQTGAVWVNATGKIPFTDTAFAEL